MDEPKQSTTNVPLTSYTVDRWLPLYMCVYYVMLYTCIVKTNSVHSLLKMLTFFFLLKKFYTKLLTIRRFSLVFSTHFHTEKFPCHTKLRGKETKKRNFNFFLCVKDTNCISLPNTDDCLGYFNCV